MIIRHVFVAGEDGFCDWRSSSASDPCGWANGYWVHANGTDGRDLPKLCGHGVNADCECRGDDQPAEGRS